MLIIYLSFVCFFVYSCSFGQSSDVGNWLIYFGNQKINSKWNWHNEVQYRSFNFLGDTNQLLLRTGIGYNLLENNNNLLLGYGFINTQKYTANSDDKSSSNEHRIYQQFITKHKVNRLFFQHRIRSEERFLPNHFQMRLRYFLGMNIPINKKTLEKNTIYLSAYNEIFINAEKPLFDRNRIYAALGFHINNYIKIEAGILAQTLEKSNRNQFQIVIFNNLPF